MSTSQSTQEWFALHVAVDGVPTVETIGNSFASLAATPEELATVPPVEVERVMQEMHLRRKAKAKIRRALADLRIRLALADLRTSPRGVATLPTLPTEEECSSDDESTDGPALKNYAPKRNEPKSDAPKSDAPKSDEPKTDASTTDAPTTDAPTTDAPTTDAPKSRAPKSRAPKSHAPKSRAPKSRAPKSRAPKSRAPKSPARPRTFRPDVPKIPGTFIVPTVSRARVSGPWKTIMVVGETGCGKTTTLNSMVNHLWGVKLQDHFRFVLVPPPSDTAAQAHSVTSQVTAYSIRPPQLSYGLTIIDTPGFGDTKGLEADMNIVEEMEKIFRHQIKSVHAIFFIVRAAGRYDSRMKYVFNAVQRLFGRNVVHNLFAVITFADGAEPPVLATMRQAKMPFKEHFELNNSGFFTGFEPEKAQPLTADACFQRGEIPETHPPPQTLMERPETKLFWEMGSQAMDKLFGALARRRACSLRRSVTTLELRKTIQQQLTQLHEQMSSARDEIATLRDEMATAKREAAAMAQNEGYCLVEHRDEKYEHSTSNKNINCPNCRHTCKMNCGPNLGNHQIGTSDVIRAGGYCGICAGKCHWTAHMVEEFTWRTRTVRETTILGDMKASFVASKSNLEETATRIGALCREISNGHKDIKSTVMDLRELTKNLTRIALLPSVMEDADYYEKLIETEESHQDDGWRERSKMLKDLKEQAGLLHGIMDADSVDTAVASIFRPNLEQLDSEVASLTQLAGRTSPARGRISDIVGAAEQMSQDIHNQRPKKTTNARPSCITGVVKSPCLWMIVSGISIASIAVSFLSTPLDGLIFSYPWARITVKAVGALLLVVALSMSSMLWVERRALNLPPNECPYICCDVGMCSVAVLPLYPSSWGEWSRCSRFVVVLFYGAIVLGALLLVNEAHSLPLYAVGVAISLFAILVYGVAACFLLYEPPPAVQPDRSRYVRASSRLVFFILLFSIGAALVVSSITYNDGFAIVEEAIGTRRNTRIMGGTIAAIGFAGFLAESTPRWWTIEKGRRLATSPTPEALRSSYRFFMAVALSSIFYGISEMGPITSRLIIQVSTLATAVVAVLAAALRLSKRNDGALWNMLRIAIFLAAYPTSLMTEERLFRNLCRATCFVLLTTALTTASMSTIDGVRKDGNGHVQRCLKTYNEVQFAGRPSGASEDGMMPYLSADGQWSDLRIGYFVVLYGGLSYSFVVVTDWIESPSRDSSVIHALRFVATLTSFSITFAYGFLTVAVNIEPPSAIVQPKLRIKYWRRMVHFLLLNFIIAFGGSLVIMAHDPRHNNIGQVDVIEDVGIDDVGAKVNVDVNVNVRMEDIGIALVIAGACAWIAEAIPRIAQPNMRQELLSCDPPRFVRGWTYFWCLLLECGIVMMWFVPPPANTPLFLPATSNLPFIGMALIAASLLVLVLTHLMRFMRIKRRTAGQPRASGEGDADDFNDDNV